MSETCCKKCGGILNPEEDCTPNLWCTCPAVPYKENTDDDDRDPSEIEDYYDLEAPFP